MFSYYNGELLAELNQNQETVGRYILGYGVAAGWNHNNEGYHFYHLDEQNSTAYVTGQNGDIANHYAYDAFGTNRECHESLPNKILYTGQQYDRITEQYYLRARYYNPAVGRFLQEDVYRGDGLNLYAYCANNPVVYYDPSGYGAVEDILKIFDNQRNSTDSANSNNPWVIFRHIVGGNGYSNGELSTAYSAMQNASGDGHYINRSYVRQNVRDQIGNDVLTFNGIIDIDEARGQNMQIDIGHKPGYEFWRTRDAAEQLHWTQAQYNDFMNRDNADMYRYEEHSYNISHQDEDTSTSLDKVLKEMTEYQEQQEANGNWERSNNDEQDGCKSD